MFGFNNVHNIYPFFELFGEHVALSPSKFKVNLYLQCVVSLLTIKEWLNYFLNMEVYIP